MKNATSYSLNLAVAVLLVIASATIAAAVEAGSDTCVGLSAAIGSTCTPLTNTPAAITLIPRSENPQHQYSGMTIPLSERAPSSSTPWVRIIPPPD